MTAGRRSIEQWAVRLLCAIALVFVGLAHRPPPALPPASEALALLLPDGSTPSLCSSALHAHGRHGDERKSGEHKTASPSCEACRIGSAILLPPPPECPVGHAGFARQAALPLPEAPLHRPLYPPNRGPRAPPPASILA